jgi:hypothetical protein
MSGERQVTGKIDFRELTRALYRVVSAAPEQRDWDAIRHYYHPEARLVRTGVNPDGAPFVSVFSLDAYIENVRHMLDGVRFSEVEVAQESVVFGNVARLTSVYEYTRQSATETVRGRGVNFFTLVHDAGQWRVMSIVWDNERPGLSLPPEVYSPRAAS